MSQASISSIPASSGKIAIGADTGIDVIIPTFNEAKHIREVIANAAQTGRVYVLDSGSKDNTRELAAQAGAVVVEHAWEGYARQKNWGLVNLPLTGRWVFILDADERITPALRKELLAIVGSSDETIVGYYVNRLMIIMGRPIRHGGLFPSWSLRFFRRGCARYEDRSVHEHMLCNGPTAYLRQLMLHIRSETMSEYMAKHIRYADLESDEWVKDRLGRGGSAEAGKLFRDILRWRQWLRRRVWPRWPFRPFTRFIYMYFFRMGFLDGKAGWHLAMLMASYEYMITLLYRDKFLTHQRQSKAQSPPVS